MAETAAAPAAGQESRASTTTDDLSELQRQLEDSQRALAEKDKRIANLTTTQRATREDSGRRVAQAENARLAAEEQALTSEIEKAKGEADRLEGEITKAFEEGRSADVAKLNRALASAQYRHDALSQHKVQFDAHKERLTAEAERRTAEDPRLANFSAPTKAWIKEHPEFLDDPTVNRRVMSAHYDALAEGLEADTPEYFEHLEERGLKRGTTTRRQEEDDQGQGNDTVAGGADVDDPISEAGGGQQREEPRRRVPESERRPSSSSRAAPPNRQSPGNPPPQNRRAPALDEGEKEAARISFPDEYAKNPADAYVLYANYRDRSITEGRLAPRNRR
jgi:hypothetical protein